MTKSAEEKKSIFEERVGRAKRLMAEKDIDALLILSLENYYYFTGDYRRQPRAVIPREGEPVLIVFRGEEEEAKANSWVKDVRSYGALHEMMMAIIGLFKERNLAQGKIGVEYEFSTPAFLLERFKLANPKVQVVDAKPVISPLRLVKSGEEIEAMGKAAEIADAGMEAAIQAVGEGVAEVEVAAEAEYVMKKRGAERMAFPTFVNSGHRSAWLHGLATYKRIEKGELVLLDLGAVYRGYCSDICRTMVVGKPTEEQKRAHQAYLSAQKAALEALRPGVKVMDLDKAAGEAMAAAGYGGYFIRGFAHGIGLGFEETPFPTIFPEDTLVEIPANSTLAVGHSVLAVPGMGGVRVEDTVLVTPEGPQLLTRCPQNLVGKED